MVKMSIDSSCDESLTSISMPQMTAMSASPNVNSNFRVSSHELQITMRRSKVLEAILEKEVPRRMQGRPTSLDGASSYVCCGICDRIEYQWAVTIHVFQQH